MKSKEIREILAQIRELGVIQDDPEKGHECEDGLYTSFVEFIAANGSLPKSVRDKARLVLSSELIEFPRWYA